VASFPEVIDVVFTSETNCQSRFYVSLVRLVLFLIPILLSREHLL